MTFQWLLPAHCTKCIHSEWIARLSVLIRFESPGHCSCLVCPLRGPTASDLEPISGCHTGAASLPQRLLPSALMCLGKLETWTLHDGLDSRPSYRNGLGLLALLLAALTQFDDLGVELAFWPTRQCSSACKPTPCGDQFAHEHSFSSHKGTWR